MKPRQMIFLTGAGCVIGVLLVGRVLLRVEQHCYPIIDSNILLVWMFRFIFALIFFGALWGAIEVFNRVRIKLLSRKEEKSIYIGLTRKELADKGYTTDRQVDFQRDDYGEFVSFTPLEQYTASKIVTFYFIGGRVAFWEREDIRTMQVMMKVHRNIKQWF